jgi:hypothetical protein
VGELVSSPLNDHRAEEAARAIRLRILNVLPAATYQMEKFLQLSDVVIDDRSETAAVEVGPQPRLHLNAAFVARHCRKDEHLLMLIMHELYHIILGHTRLFPRLTKAHNIVFDAIINAMLCRQFREPQYVSFFEQVNRSRKFPARLLRPPSGWLKGRMRIVPSASAAERKVMNLLYASPALSATYHEVFELLKEDLESQSMAAPDGAGAPGPSKKEPGDEPVLLGDHSGAKGEGALDEVASKDGVVKEVLRGMTRDWPPEARENLQRGAGVDPLKLLLPKPRSPRTEFLVALKRLLSKVGVLRPGAGAAYAWKRLSSAQEFSSVLPNWRDRHAFSREALNGDAPLDYKDEVHRPRPRWTPQNQSHVYIDVSGSMAECLPWLVAALDSLQRRGVCRLFAFSTVVDPVRKGALAEGRVRTTLGTNIACVFEHLLGLPPGNTPRRAVILTDGYTGTPAEEMAQGVKKRGCELHVGLVGPIADEETLSPYAKVMERLPKLG